MHWLQAELNGTITVPVFGSAASLLSGPQDNATFRQFRQRIGQLVAGALLRALGMNIEWGTTDGTVGCGGLGGTPGSWARAWTLSHTLEGSSSTVIHQQRRLGSSPTHSMDRVRHSRNNVLSVPGSQTAAVPHEVDAARSARRAQDGLLEPDGAENSTLGGSSSGSLHGEGDVAGGTTVSGALRVEELAAIVEMYFDVVAREQASDESGSGSSLEPDGPSQGGSSSTSFSSRIASNLTNAVADQTFVRQLIASDPDTFSSETRSAPTAALLTGLTAVVRLVDQIDPDVADSGNNGSQPEGSPVTTGEEVSFSIRELVVGVVLFVVATAVCVGSVFGGLWYMNARQSAAVQADLDAAHRLAMQEAHADDVEGEEGEGDLQAARRNGKLPQKSSVETNEGILGVTPLSYNKDFAAQERSEKFGAGMTRSLTFGSHEPELPAVVGAGRASGRRK